MINKSIAYRLSIYISLAVIGVFISFIIITFFYNQNRLKNDLDDWVNGKSMEIIMKIEKQLISTQEISSNIADQILYYSQNNDAGLFLAKLLVKYTHLNAIKVNIDSGVTNLNYRNYYTYREKDTVLFRQQNEKFFVCQEEKEKLEDITDSDTPAWTEPFRCNRNQNVISAYFTPIKVEVDGGQKKIGEVICELSLLDLNDSINNFKIDEKIRGYAFLISKDGTFITHPSEELILNRNVFTVSDEIYDKNKVDVNKILDKRLSGSLTIYSEKDFGKSKAFYAPIKENDWTLILVIPDNDLYEPMYLSMLQMLFFSVLGILVIYLIITYISNRLLEPLSNVTSQLKRFSSLSGEEELKTMNEIKLVSESLNYLKSWYEKYKIQLSQEEKRNHRSRQDLLEASAIQKSLIKTEFPKDDYLDIYALYKPARVVGGDLYDFFYLDDDHIILTIGDVSGKGIPAAFFMSVAQTIIKSSATDDMARNIVYRTNNDLCTNNQHQFFLTLFLGILNIKTGHLNYCSAAHINAYILKSNAEIIELSQSHGLPLGLYPEKQYPDSKIKIDSGDTIILFTDGLSDQLDDNHLQFGNKRIAENIKVLKDLNSEELVNRLYESLKLYRGNTPQTDDISILVVKYKTKKQA